MTLEAFALLCRPTGYIRIVEWNDDMCEYETLMQYQLAPLYDAFSKELTDEYKHRVIDNVWTEFDIDTDENSVLVIEVVEEN